MSSVRVAFLTTVFPANRIYLDDFFSSLKKQTHKNFDVVVVNDGIEHFAEYIDKYGDLNVVELNYSDTPAKNREFGINYCIEHGYDILIFGDSDDYFANNRVGKSLELLKEYDIVVNDLSLFDESGIYEEKYISYRLDNMSTVDFRFIKDKNIFGLSNTAIKLSNLSRITIPDRLVAIDWYLFSIFLLNGQKAIFTNDTISYYRQYNQNTIGFKELNEAFFREAIAVKKQHYEAIEHIGYRLDLEISGLSSIAFDDIKKINNPLWWEIKG